LTELARFLRSKLPCSAPPSTRGAAPVSGTQAVREEPGADEPGARVAVA
jgi:hypothetical protein